MTAILSWPIWQVDGEFSSELFRSFSFLFSGKGLPKEGDVTAILSWPVWQVNGVFNHELFRSICSTFRGKGLPKERDVTACVSSDYRNRWYRQRDTPACDSPV